MVSLGTDKNQTEGNSSLRSSGKEKMGTSKQALVVDDDGVVRRFLADFITKKGFSCSQAEDFHEGAKRLADGPYDLIMVDFSMPGGTGDRLIAVARHLYPKSKIISISSSDSGEILELVKRAGADFFLRKPLGPDDLARI
jgi:two-component system phosphate regulon response regulator PhoB